MQLTQEERDHSTLQLFEIKATGMTVCGGACKRILKHTELYRCLYCDIFFCVECGEVHFGKTRAEWYAAEQQEQRQ